VKELPDLRVEGDAVLLPVAARPGASRSAVQGVHDGALKVAIQAPPEKGKANKALVSFLAKALGLRKAQVSLAQGTTSRAKTFRFEGADPDAIRARLDELL
jgi:uncharacterized protein (TIGR00251 family)